MSIFPELADTAFSLEARRQSNLATVDVRNYVVDGTLTFDSPAAGASVGDSDLITVSSVNGGALLSADGENTWLELGVVSGTYQARFDAIPGFTDASASVDVVMRFPHTANTRYRQVRNFTRTGAPTPAVSITSPTAGATVGLGTVIVLTSTSPAEVRVANVGGVPANTGSWVDYFTGITLAGIVVPGYAASASFDIEARLKGNTGVTDAIAYVLPDLAITAPAAGSTISGTTEMVGTGTGDLEWTWSAPGGPWTPDPGNS